MEPTNDLMHFIECKNRGEMVLVSTCKRCRLEIAFTAPSEIPKEVLMLVMIEVLDDHYNKECRSLN